MTEREFGRWTIGKRVSFSNGFATHEGIARRYRITDSTVEVKQGRSSDFVPVNCVRVFHVDRWYML